MISVSVWKRSGVMPTPRPSNGPASQPGQPPLRAGTYVEGRVAAPAAIRKTVATTPISPSAPSARSAPIGIRAPVASSMSLGPRPVTRALAMGVVACMGLLLRLGDVRRSGVPDTLCLLLRPPGHPAVGARSGRTAGSPDEA